MSCNLQQLYTDIANAINGFETIISSNQDLWNTSPNAWFKNQLPQTLTPTLQNLCENAMCSPCNTADDLLNCPFLSYENIVTAMGPGYAQSYQETFTAYYNFITSLCPFLVAINNTLAILIPCVPQLSLNNITYSLTFTGVIQIMCSIPSVSNWVATPFELSIRTQYHQAWQILKNEMYPQIVELKNALKI
jgi:hypothetical protein